MGQGDCTLRTRLYSNVQAAYRILDFMKTKADEPLCDRPLL